MMNIESNRIEIHGFTCSYSANAMLTLTHMLGLLTVAYTAKATLISMIYILLISLNSDKEVCTSVLANSKWSLIASNNNLFIVSKRY